MTPLLPCLPATLSPTWISRFVAIYTLTNLMIPGRNSSPLRIFSIRSSFCSVSASILPCARRFILLI